jgi:hypothetical protein
MVPGIETKMSWCDISETLGKRDLWYHHNIEMKMDDVNPKHLILVRGVNRYIVHRAELSRNRNQKKFHCTFSSFLVAYSVVGLFIIQYCTFAVAITDVVRYNHAILHLDGSYSMHSVYDNDDESSSSSSSSSSNIVDKFAPNMFHQLNHVIHIPAELEIPIQIPMIELYVRSNMDYVLRYYRYVPINSTVMVNSADGRLYKKSEMLHFNDSIAEDSVIFHSLQWTMSEIPIDIHLYPLFDEQKMNSFLYNIVRTFPDLMSHLYPPTERVPYSEGNIIIDPNARIINIKPHLLRQYENTVVHELKLKLSQAIYPHIQKAQERYIVNHFISELMNNTDEAFHEYSHVLYQPMSGDLFSDPVVEEYFMNEKWMNHNSEMCIWQGIGCDQRRPYLNFHRSIDECTNCLPYKLDARVVCTTAIYSTAVTPTTIPTTTEPNDTLYTYTNEGRLKSPGFALHIHMQDRQFSGRLAEGLSSLQRLETLDASYNKLRGTIPQDFAAVKQLRSFNVAHNNLTGTVPTLPVAASSNHAYFKVLQELNLSNNNINGTIPSLLARCTNLQL